MLLDEPTAALDLKHQHIVLQFVKNLAKEEGWGIAIVIHDLHLARMYADNMIFMKCGEIYRDVRTDAYALEDISKVFDIPEDLAKLYH